MQENWEFEQFLNPFSDRWLALSRAEKKNMSSCYLPANQFFATAVSFLVAFKEPTAAGTSVFKTRRHAFALKSNDKAYLSSQNILE